MAHSRRTTGRTRGGGTTQDHRGTRDRGGADGADARGGTGGTPASFSRRVRRLGAMTLACALATSGLALGAVTALPSAAHAAAGGDARPQVAGDDWRTSFEQDDAQPLASTPLGDPVNVTGSTGYAPGSLAPYVTDVTATAENPPGETAVNLTDANPASKWLAFERTATITYLLDGPHPLAEYTLTSGNDAPERDPRSFTVSGSTDGGATWTALDTQADVAFEGRQSSLTFPLAAGTGYDAYRLEITENGGAGLTQLADWTLSDGSDAVPPSGPMATEVGGGPVTGLTNKPGAGFSGTKSLRYAGEHVAAGEATASNVLYEGLDLEIGSDSVFSYKVFPELGGDLQYPATWAAVDLQLDDGTLVSGVDGIVDGHGEDVSARGQGSSKILYADHWNSVRVPLGDLAGRTVEKVLLSYDNPGGSADTRFQGWVDDLDLDPAPPAFGGDELVESVDTRRGTNSTGSFSRGNNVPATAVPNGFNFWTPMTAASSQSWLYDWSRGNDAQNLPRLQGLGISHEPSPWMGDRNQLALLPSATVPGAGGATAPDATLTTRALQFDHGSEVARPDLYSVATTSGLETAVTPTDHGAVMRFGFPEPADDAGADAARVGSVLVDRVAGTSELTVSPDGVLSGWVEGGSGLSVGASRMFVWGQFDRTPTSVGTAAGDRTGARFAAFDATDASGTSPEGVVELRLATSFLSLDQARHSHDLELADRSFEQVREAASAQWEDRLGVITVEGARDDQLATLYGSLYRLNLYPNSQFENTGTTEDPVHRYASPVAPKQGEATATTTNAQVKDGEIYVNNGFWDTYRTVWPAYSMLYPDVAERLVDGFVQMERDSGWIARWSSPGYADLMTGTSSDVAFADAYVKGAIDGDLALEAYDAGLKNASVQPTQSGVGRKGLDRSLFLGYTPESTHESVSWGLEGAINDFGLGQMAAKLADDPATPDERRDQLREESAWLLDRAEEYPALFDPEIGFFQARNEDGTFATPAAEYDPGDWGGAYTETNGWNFAFHAPFDVPGLAALYGGPEGLDAKLAEFYGTPERADKPGGYGGVIHEMLEARDVRMGQLGMSNQVSHHIPYVSEANGDPATTQAAVREITQRLFVGSDIGQGYPGDEDNGEMSSWFVFSALGFYPLAMGTDSYTIGSPLFDEATIHLDGGRTFTITAEGNSVDAVHVQSATLNGEALDTVDLPQSAIAAGGELTFVMGEQPSGWAAGAPEAVEVPTPLVDATTPGQGVTSSSDGTAVGALVDDSARSAVTFTDPEAQVTWQSASGPVQVERYTLTNGPDGSAAPTAWRLEGSSDGTTWTTLDERDGEAFPSSLQTRPFTVADPSPLSWYRLVTVGTTEARPATLSELELMADPTATAGELAVTPRPDLTAEVGSTFEGPVATVTGASGTDAPTVTVDWLDGTGPQPATTTPAALGGLDVVAPAHVLDRVGAQPVVVTATDGTRMATATATVTVSRTAPSPTGAFDSVCLGDPGQAANCDYLQNGFSRTSLAADGFVQGTTVPVPGTELTFDLPAVPAGQPDNATGNGQVLPLDLGDDVTQLSVVGTATERPQQTVGTLTFDDGSTQPLPIEFGDWTASRTSPAFGNLLVATSDFRTVGASGTNATPAAIYATAPVTLPEGKVAVSLTMPVQTGDPRAAGRVHVFAVATDGTRLAPPAPLALTAGAPLTGTAGEEVQGVLATIDGEVREGVTATVAWGDGTALEDAVVDGSTVTGSHVYALPGERTVTVTVDDGRGSASTTTTATIAAAPVWSPTIAVAEGDVEPGAAAAVTGAGFAPDEEVTVTLALGDAGGDVTVTDRTDAAGALATSVTVPVGTAGGTYPVTALGAVSQTAASDELTVAGEQGPGEPGEPGPGEPGGPGDPGPGQPGWTPELRVLADSAVRGTVVPVDGSGFAPGETVALTLFSDPIALGTLTADGDGIVRGSFTVPAAASTGAHEVEALGGTSQTAVRAAFRVVDTAPADQGVRPVRPGTGDGSLAFTGGPTQDPTDGALVAGVLVASGLALVGLGLGARRRRRLDALGLVDAG